MSADSRHSELSRWLLDAVGKVRRQKQRPSIERICAAVRQLHPHVTDEQVSSQLDDAVRTGAVICIENKGVVSYREPSSSCLPAHASGKRLHSSSSDATRPGLAAVSQAVILAVREIGSGCSEDMIRQHVKKHCQDASQFPSTDLHVLVTDACNVLVNARVFSSSGGLFYLKSTDDFTLSRASSTSLFAGDYQMPSTTFTDSQVLCNLVLILN